MSEFTPKRLTKAQIKKEFDHYLEEFERRLLHEHMNQFLAEHAPGGIIEADEFDAISAKITAERDRLLALAPKKGGK